MFTFDFETHAIESRPDYPPMPVGLARSGRTIKYLAASHPTGNNASTVDIIATLESDWQSPLLCHNAAFDIAVAHEKLGLPLPDGAQINDTMFLAFLMDPYGELSLKPLTEKLLGMPPQERDAVRDWLKANYRMPKTNRAPTDKQCRALIALAPGNVVAPYGVSDVDRTIKLFKHLVPKVQEAGMWEAYRRECEIMPMLLDNSAQGIPLDHKRLAIDLLWYEGVLNDVETELHRVWKREIGGSAPANFDSGDELAECLQVNPAITLPRTPTGRVSTAKEALIGALPPHGRVLALLLYRSAIDQCLSTYMRPWHRQGKALHANWNQVRDYSDRGAKTGRLSSSPNLQNMTNPEKYEEVARLLAAFGNDYDWCIFPNLRSYIVAPKGMVLFSRDYSQQEFRMLAHYEDGVIAEAYRANPDEDMHILARDIINDVTGIGIERKPTKTINFGKVYGMGIPALAKKLGLEISDAHLLMNAYDTALPSVKALMKEVGAIGKAGDFITTLGGRRYYSPPASFDPDTKRVRTFEYKLLNYLMQGGSADQTKEAMRLWWNGRLRGSTNGTRFLLTVHDQLVGCAPKKDAKCESEALDEYMVNAFTLDVPTKTDPTYGTNFGEMK